MTIEQKKSISVLHEQYLKNGQHYIGFNTLSYCTFTTLKNDINSEDDNIVLIWSRIKGLDNYGIPQNEIINFLIEPNGKFYEMDMMPNVFLDSIEIISYIQKLTKFNWDAE
jgi:hypothetical protein